MKHLTLIFCLALVGCSDIFSFDIDRQISEQRVQGSPIGGVLPDVLDLAIPLDIDLEHETSARDTGPVQKVYLSALSLEVTATAEPSGDSDDLGFIDSVDVFVVSTKGDTSLPRVQVASLSNVSEGARAATFNTTNVNIRNYVEEGARIETEGRGSAPPDDTTYRGAFTITVEVL